MKKQRFLIGLWVGLVLLLGGCFSQEDSEPGCSICPGEITAPVTPAPFETIEQGIHSGIKDPRQLVIRDATTWVQLWIEHVAGRASASPRPVIDFAREMVIAFFLGEKPTSGYSVEIKEIFEEGDKLIVKVEVAVPPPWAMPLQVLTQPFHIVKMPRFDLPEEFVVVEVETKH